jgi:hypothetical protein
MQSKKETIAALKGESCRNCMHLEIDVPEDCHKDEGVPYCCITHRETELNESCEHWEYDGAT